jgi:hypothetical protein
MVVEQFKNRDAVAVYRRFRDRGRLMPEGLRYVSSWVETNWDRCFQLMECEDPALFDRWIAQWNDLMTFEVVPVIPSSEAVVAIAPQL